MFKVDDEVWWEDCPGAAYPAKVIYIFPWWMAWFVGDYAIVAAEDTETLEQGIFTFTWIVNEHELLHRTDTNHPSFKRV